MSLVIKFTLVKDFITSTPIGKRLLEFEEHSRSRRESAVRFPGNDSSDVLEG